MAFTDKIRLVIDVASDGAKSALSGLKNDLADADGAFGKTKVAAGGAFDFIKANAGAAALGAGTALVGFGVKAVSAFQDTALAAGKMADSSGLAVDEASRWIAVGDDIGVSGETMSKGFNKLNIEVAKSNPLLTELGITTQHTADGQVDANATMLRAIDIIKGIQDPTKKAAAAQAAFGKGWMEMGELINMGSRQITAGMAEVSDAQVVDQTELDKARKFRDALDSLQDAVGDLAISAGEALVPALTDAAAALSELGPVIETAFKAVGVGTGLIGDAQEAIGDFAYNIIPGATESMANQFRQSEEAADSMFAGLSDGVATMGGFIAALDRANVSGTERALLINKFVELYPQESAAVKELTRAQESSAEIARGLANATTEVGETAEETTERLRSYHDRVMELKSAYAELRGELSVEEDFLNAEAMWADLQKSAVDAYTAASGTAEEAAAAALAHRQEVNDAKQAVVELGEKYADLPESEITTIVAMIDEGQLEEAERRFNILTRNREMQVSIITNGGVGFGVGARATGGPVTAGNTYLVGEQGPELLTMGANGHVTPNGQLSSGGGNTYNITLQSLVPDRRAGNAVVRLIKEYEESNGKAWRDR